MARYLDSVGAKQRVSFDVTRDLSMMVLEQANVIAVGTHQTLQPLHEYPQAMNFFIFGRCQLVEEMWRRNGQPEFFEMVVKTELENKRAIRSWPVAIHRFASQAPTDSM